MADVSVLAPLADSIAADDKGDADSLPIAPRRRDRSMAGSVEPRPLLHAKKEVGRWTAGDVNEERVTLQIQGAVIQQKDPLEVSGLMVADLYQKSTLVLQPPDWPVRWTVAADYVSGLMNPFVDVFIELYNVRIIPILPGEGGLEKGPELLVNHNGPIVRIPVGTFPRENLQFVRTCLSDELGEGVLTLWLRRSSSNAMG